METPASATASTALVDYLAELGRRVDTAGVDAVPADELATVTALASRFGAPAVLVAIVTDRTEPVAARTRALGRLARHLAEHTDGGFILAA